MHDAQGNTIGYSLALMLPMQTRERVLAVRRHPRILSTLDHIEVESDLKRTATSSCPASGLAVHEATAPDSWVRGALRHREHLDKGSTPWWRASVTRLCTPREPLLPNTMHSLFVLVVRIVGKADSWHADIIHASERGR